MNKLLSLAERVRARLSNYWVLLAFRDLEDMKAKRACIEQWRRDELAREHAAHKRRMTVIHRHFDDMALDLDHRITKTEIHLDRMAEDIAPAPKVMDFRPSKAA